MTSVVTHGPRETTAWVLHPELTAQRNRRPAAPALEEGIALATALPGLVVAGGDIVRLSKPHPGKLFGKGKIAEIKEKLEEAEVELVLIDGTLSPVQQRNLEKSWNVKILDRTGLILEIFADRARTREGVLQVELAALTYQRSRLVRSWTHLERQRGGLGFVGGPGETQIEADRRAIDDAANRIRRQLAKVVKTRALHRASRAKTPYPIVALVGYTNAGKSTLFNSLTGAEVMAKDMLFATLDPTMRGLELAGGTNIILSDTVGFISALPTELVAAFRATLEEVLSADVICHVRDIAHNETEAQAKDVRTILTSLGVQESTPMIEVWNKIDLLSADDREGLVNSAYRREDVVAISSITGQGLDRLQSTIGGLLRPQLLEDVLHLGWGDGKKRAWLHDADVITQERRHDDGYDITVSWTERQAQQYRAVH